VTESQEPAPRRLPGWLVVLAMTLFVGGFIYLLLLSIGAWDR